MPSRETQESRRAAIPAPAELERRLTGALQDTPFRDDAFAEFAERAEQTRSGRLLEAGDFDGSPLASWRDAHLLRVGDQWVSVISLTEPQLPALLTLIRDDGDGAGWLDMREQSIQLMQNYRGGAVSMLSVAAIAILLLLWFQRRNLRQLLWIALTVTAALMSTVAVITALHGQLTVIHLVALLLVIGLGLDYALFLSRSEAAARRSSSRHAVLACAASTTAAFAILAGSSIPMLKFLGLTVAAGSALCYAMAFAGSWVPHYRSP